MMQEPIVKFWMVWRLEGNFPIFKRMTKRAAREEATRLAERNPGSVFVVLASVDACVAPVGPVEAVKMRRATEEEILDSEVPF